MAGLGMLMLLLVAIVGCANVKAFERGYLADPIMTDRLMQEEQSYENHMHRALSQGLVGITQGGGCGCEQ